MKGLCEGHVAGAESSELQLSSRFSFHSVVRCCWISRAGSSTVLVQCQWYPFYVQVMPNSAPFSQADPIERYGK